MAGEVRWQNVALGAAIGGAIGLTGGAVAAKLTTGYALANTGVVAVGAKVAVQAIGASGYVTFDAFRRAYGSAGEGMNWHHIVEQHAGNIARFGAERIHHLGSKVKVEAGMLGMLHNEISRYYSRSDPFLTGEQTVRGWLQTKGWAFQYHFGLEVLVRFAKQLGVTIEFVK